MSRWKITKCAQLRNMCRWHDMLVSHSICMHDRGVVIPLLTIAQFTICIYRPAKLVTKDHDEKSKENVTEAAAAAAENGDKMQKKDTDAAVPTK